MQSIDFLPPTYRRPRAKRKVRLWSLLVVLLFGGVIGGVEISQSRVHEKVAAEVDKIELQKNLADLIRTEWASMSQRFQEGNNDAQLLTYLKHPWPKTRILEALVKNIPSTITFQDLVLAREESTESQAGSSDRSLAEEVDFQAELEKLPSLAQDLHVLSDRYDSCHNVIFIRGVAPDAVVVHRYVRQLNNESLIAKAELISIEGLPERDGYLESEFRIRVVVVPPYGRAEGPRGATSLLLDIADK